VRAHVTVSGNVQGVFFRSQIRSHAEKHHVNGWVRNLPDGRVEAVFEGEQEDVTALVQYCRTGPPAARVESADVTWHPYLDEYGKFEIEY